MTNPNNFGVFSGRLGADPTVFQNNDGSQKVKLSVYAQNNFKNNDGSVGSVRASFEAFINAEKAANNKNVYNLMHEGDKITVMYEIRDNDYTDKQGNKVFDEVKQIVTVTLDESKAVTSQRQAARAAAANAAAAAAPAPAQA